MGGSKKSGAGAAAVPVVSAKQPQKQQQQQQQAKKQPAHSQPQMNSDSDDDSDAEQVAAVQSDDDEDASPAPVADKKKKKKKKKKAAAPVQAVESDASESDAEEHESPVVAAAAPSKRSASSGKPASSSKSPPSTYKGNYPPSRFGRTPHPLVPFWIALSTYFGYGLLIAVGHVRDFFNRWGLFRTEKSSPQSHKALQTQAPLVSDFDDFYTRRLYHRIEECWNRPISSCPASVTTMMVRSRSAYGQPYEVTGEHRHVLNLGSYNYLGFGDPNSPTREAVFASLERYGISTTSTRVNMGTTALHAELEEVTARFVGKEAAMIFGMGFGTNSTGIPALAGKGGLIISDSNNHASIAVGARTSGAVIRVFKHNDMRSLEAVLRHAIVSGQPKSHRPWTKILILVEGIYSMEGEMAPLPEIVALKKKYGAYLFVDEAHSIGAIGDNGRGICEYAGVDPRDVDVLMGTFTKSFGAVGGYIAADRDVIEFLRANSAGSLYSSSISPPAVQQVLSAFRIMMHEDGTTIGRRKLDTLRENSNYFRSRLNEMGCHTLGDWDSPIVLLMLYHPAKITAFSTECLRRGLAVVVVGFPATPLLLARVRFCLSAGHTREQLDFALRQIEDVADQIGVKYAI